MSSPTRALMTKRRDMVEHCDDKQRIELAETNTTIKKKAREDIRKYNQDIIRETSMASKSKPRQSNHTPRRAGYKNPCSR